ncbi:phospholipase D family protein [Micrococcus lylae]|uniref:phospholipase D family protein n=1 Tax=Micrococcus lylae TaxID=1273 RepID=UPI00117FC2A3|nr:phospholipase D family protein [Micrococcus lylae]
MHLLRQPFDRQLGPYLIDQLTQGNFIRLSAAVAFAKNSGVSRLRDALTQFRSGGAKVEMVVGIDLQGTSYEALMNLLDVTDSLWVAHDTGGRTFHPKLYNFVGDQTSKLVVGSHNLTLGGLWTNYESSLQLTLDLSDRDHRQTQNDVDTYFQRLKNLNGQVRAITSRNDVRELENEGYVTKEAVIGARAPQRKPGSRIATTTGTSGSLFSPGPKVPFPSATPRHTSPTSNASRTLPNSPSTQVVSTSAAPLSPDATDDPTLWIITGAMTSGSRNQLDLSKESKIITGDAKGTAFALPQKADRIKGAVTFFDVDPKAHNSKKEITVNFEGEDYEKNTITYTSHNGSWRLLLNGTTKGGANPKGASSVPKRITNAFSATANGSHLLPHKIVAFTRIGKDYYQLSVIDLNDQITLEANSWVVALNGTSPNARRLGYI